jgi:hypothetical protein
MKPAATRPTHHRRENRRLHRHGKTTAAAMTAVADFVVKSSVANLLKEHVPGTRKRERLGGLL